MEKRGEIILCLIKKKRIVKLFRGEVIVECQIVSNKERVQNKGLLIRE